MTLRAGWVPGLLRRTHGQKTQGFTVVPSVHLNRPWQCQPATTRAAATAATTRMPRVTAILHLFLHLGYLWIDSSEDSKHI